MNLSVLVGGAALEEERQKILRPGQLLSIIYSIISQKGKKETSLGLYNKYQAIYCLRFQCELFWNNCERNRCNSKASKTRAFRTNVSSGKICLNDAYKQQEY